MKQGEFDFYTIMKNENKQITVITGEQSEIHECINDWFRAIIYYIDKNVENKLKDKKEHFYLLHPDFEIRKVGIIPIKYLMIGYSESDYKQDNNGLYCLDRLYSLLYKDKIIATVTEQRDAFNYVQFSFFNHNLEKIIENAKK